MTISRRRFSTATAATLLASALPVGRAGAQGSFPSKPIRLYCPWPVGGGGDAQMRLLATLVGTALNQSVVVENKPGAAGAMGALNVTRARPDGYTLSQSHNGAVRYPYMLPSPPYDPLSDFTYILGVSDNPFGLVVRQDAPWRTLEEFLEHARARPDTVTLAVPGTGSPGHVVSDQIAEQRKIRWTAIPFKGTAESMTALMGGHVTGAADSTGWSTYVDSGKMRLLAVFTTRRLKKYPNVPTLKESGIDASDYSPWGIVGPAGMETPVVRVLHDAFKAAMSHPDFENLLTNLAQEPIYMSGDAYRTYVTEAMLAQQAIVKRYGLKQG